MTARHATTIAVLLAAGCLPQQSNSGGNDPPISIGDIFGPLFGDDEPTGPDAATGDDLIFDIVIEATSLEVSGINVRGVLRLVPRTGVDGATQPYAEATLQDTFNDPRDVVGIAGGVFLTASSSLLFSSSGPFELRSGDNGAVNAVFVGGRGSTLTNKFFLAADAVAFVPGQIAPAFEVDAGSSFTFLVEGGGVSGTFDLSGASIISASGSTEVYEGTFTGVLRQ